MSFAAEFVFSGGPGPFLEWAVAITFVLVVLLYLVCFGTYLFYVIARNENRKELLGLASSPPLMGILAVCVVSSLGAMYGQAIDAKLTSGLQIGLHNANSPGGAKPR
jgi:ABC-type transport system involved in cytochrome c biogenesis permease subunit